MDIEKIKKTLKPIIENEGYVLDSLTFEKEGKLNFLRVVIDKDGILEIEDCVKVSNLINPILDKQDPIKENYILDVCTKEEEN